MASDADAPLNPQRNKQQYRWHALANVELKLRWELVKKYNKMTQHKLMRWHAKSPVLLLQVHLEDQHIFSVAECLQQPPSIILLSITNDKLNRFSIPLIILNFSTTYTNNSTLWTFQKSYLKQTTQPEIRKQETGKQTSSQIFTSITHSLSKTNINTTWFYSFYIRPWKRTSSKSSVNRTSNKEHTRSDLIHSKLRLPTVSLQTLKETF
jgi:hypothetical protein